MEQKQIHLKSVGDVANAFNIGVHEIEKILIHDGFRHAYELKDGRILTGENYDNGMNSHAYTGGTVALYDNREEFNEYNPFGVKLTIGNEEFDLLEEMERIEKQRNELLDKIVERANKREGQHLYEIIQEVRSLCSQLEGTMVN